MTRSFVRLTVRSVLACWVLGFVILLAYVQTRSWIPERARKDGVFLARDLLADAPPAERIARLDALAPNLPVPLAIVDRAEAERRLGAPIAPGDARPLRVHFGEEWYFLAFRDSAQVLIAGPVEPSRPAGAIPIGLFIALGSLPLLGGLIAFRIARELSKVERASQALAVGELSARVDNPTGPSNELAASFNAMAERVERLIRDRDELVQAVSHELGHPLSRLRFHLELLGPQIVDHSRADAMAAELDALDALVAELMTYVQSETHPLTKTRFDPRAGLEDLAELALLDLPADRTLDIAVEVDEGVRVYADRRQFDRAIENLLRNAARYAAATVRVVVTATSGRVRVAVHDDGPGIPAAMRDRVQRPFVRLDQARDRAHGGMGLGLAIVGRIVRRHGGRLIIETAPMGGALVATEWPT